VEAETGRERESGTTLKPRHRNEIGDQERVSLVGNVTSVPDYLGRSLGAGKSFRGRSSHKSSERGKKYSARQSPEETQMYPNFLLNWLLRGSSPAWPQNVRASYVQIKSSTRRLGELRFGAWQLGPCRQTAGWTICYLRHV